MMKNSYIELKLKNQVLIRQRSRHSMNNKIKQLGLTTLIKQGKFHFVEIVATSLPKKVGSIFEGNLN
jgi:hypothetical protein|tara:strand:- start:25110 stop:25310 length:201 start_codon:yes stop_codon:yes gene_type:complete